MARSNGVPRATSFSLNQSQKTMQARTSDQQIAKLRIWDAEAEATFWRVYFSSRGSGPM